MSSRASAVVVLGAVLVFAIWARLSTLGDSELWIDEYYHYFAAEGLARGVGPLLPSGARYGRGITTTRLASAAREIVSDPVVATRLPSAMFGIAAVLIMAAIAWRLGGPWAAVWGALLLGTYPGAVSQARNARFYSEQLAIALVALWLAWLALRSPPDENERSPLLAQWAPIAGAAVAFAFGATVQPTTLSVAVAASLALGLAALADLRATGRRAIARSARVQAAALGVIACVVILTTRTSAVAGLMRAATEAPLWARGRYSPLAYYWVLSEWEPLLVATAPVIFVIVALRNVRLAVFLALWVGVPLALHSLVFRFQSERYILAAVPGLLLAGGIALADLSTRGYRALRQALETRSSRPRRASVLAGSTVAFAALMLVVTSPAFTYTRKAATGAITRTRTNWGGVLEIMRRIPGSDTIPWGSRDPLASLAAWGRVDFTIYRGYLERPALPGDSRRGLVTYGDGVPDYYSGVPVLTTPEAIRRRFAASGAAVIVVDSAYDADVRSELMRTLHREARDVCDSACGPMHVYYWRFDDDAGKR